MKKEKPMTKNSFKSEVEKILERYGNYLSCEEYHIHSDDPEFADERNADEDDHQEFDDERALEAILALHEAECDKRVAEARAEEWRYASEALHSALLTADIYLTESREEHISELKQNNLKRRK